MATTNATQIACADEPALLDSLLRRERKRFSTYWTLIQEMAIRGQLPDWVRAGFPAAGTHEDWDAQSADQCATDLSVHGKPVLARYSLGQSNDNTMFLYSQDGRLLFDGSASELPLHHPDALSEFTHRQLQLFASALQTEAELRDAKEAA